MLQTACDCLPLQLKVESWLHDHSSNCLEKWHLLHISEAEISVTFDCLPRVHRLLSFPNYL